MTVRLQAEDPSMLPHRRFVAAILILACVVPLLPAETADDHAALRDLMSRAATALNGRRIEDLSAVLREPCDVVAVDQSRATSAVAVKAMFDRWISPEGGIAALAFKPVVDGPATFLDERTAFASGTSEDSYVLRDGRTVVIPQRWSATVVKDGGVWRIATLHTGVDLMANPVLDAVRAAMWRNTLLIGAAAAVAGGLGGWWLGRRQRREG